MIECNSIASGIEAADFMIKAALVEPLMLKTICPGKFVVAVYGEVASVRSSLDAGLASAGASVVDHFLIPNISHPVISAMACALAEPHGTAVGVVETFSAAATIEAADAAVKAANVELIEVRIAMGLGGKGFSLLCGDVAGVQTAVDAGAATAMEKGLLVRKVVIPSMAPQVLRHLM
ncbi:MAG: BMC domain-containing protein [Desulfovibrionaceae bacterium]|jgi:microcompartment protein CcmL/EutN|nr:BMC domain-containing protein [Desulfovibrionaceae bacterium]